MKHFIKKFGLAISLTVIALMACAIPVLADALYTGNIQVTNNGTAATHVAAVFDLDSQSMIDNGFAESDFSDVSITYNGVPIQFQPGVGANPWCIYVPAIGTSSLNYVLYSKGATGGAIRYFPGATGMAVTDHTTIEVLGNGAVSFDDIYLDTTVNSTIFEKPNAWGAYTLDNGNVSLRMLVGSAINYPYVASNSTGSANAITFDGTMPSGKTAGDMLIWNINSYRAAGSVSYTLPAGWTLLSSLDYSGGTTNNAYYYKVATSSDANQTVTMNNIAEVGWRMIRIPSGYYSGVPVAGVQTSGNDATADPPNLVTGFGEVKTLFMAFASAINVAITAPPAGYSGFTFYYPNHAYVAMAYKQATSASDNPGTFTNGAGLWGAETIAIKGNTYIETTHAVTASEKTAMAFSVNATSGNLEIWENGALLSSITRSGNNVTNNANPYQFGGDGTPYFESVSVTVNGTLQTRLAYEYDTIFHDSVGNNDGTPSFRTTSSDPDVSAELISFEPSDSSELDSFTFAGDLPDIGTPDTQSQMYTEGTYDKIPGADSVNEVLGEAGVPYALWWYPFIYFAIGIIGLMVYGATQGPMSERSTSNPFDGSLLIMAVVMEALIVVAGIMNPVPLWPAYLFPIPALAIIISRRHQTWG